MEQIPANIERKVLGELNRSDSYSGSPASNPTPTKPIQEPVVQSTPVIKVSEASSTEGEVAKEQTPVRDINTTFEQEENILAEESYINPASGLSFLTEQLNNCGIKDVSSDDEAFQECQSFTSSKGIASNPDSRVLTPVNFEREPTSEINATFETAENSQNQTTPTANGTFNFDSGLNSTETIQENVEDGVEVLEDLQNLNLNATNETIQPLNISQPRSPLAELSLEDVEKHAANRTPEIETVRVDAVDVLTVKSPVEEEKEVTIERTEVDSTEILGDPKVIENLDQLEARNQQEIAQTEEKPEDTPLPADDFDDFIEENQENIPPLEITHNASVTDTISVVDKENSIEACMQESTFEGDTAIFVVNKLEVTKVRGTSLDKTTEIPPSEPLEQEKIQENPEKIEETPSENNPRVFTYQESFDERPIKGVAHSESLAAFEKIEAELNEQPKKDLETPLTVEVDPIPPQTEQEKAESNPNEPTFILGEEMPESKGIPMDVDDDMFDFPPPPKEMLDEIEQTTALAAEKTPSPTPLNGFSNGEQKAAEVFVEDFNTVNIDATFKKPAIPPMMGKRRSGDKLPKNLDDEQFQSSAGFQFSASDFDYLEACDNKNSIVDRNSLLLRFDPLLKQPVPDTHNPKPTQIVEESEQDLSLDARTERNPFETSIEDTKSPLELDLEAPQQEIEPVIEQKSVAATRNETMSITLANNNVETFEDGLKSEIKIMSAQENSENMSELDKKVKNEVLKTEELEKRLEEEIRKRMEAEQKEEQLLKRITEKEKAYTKLQNIVAEYEKAISEMITEKEQLLANEQRKYTNLHADSETNAQHLASLETTFSDLHAKYERTKQIAMDLKDQEVILIAEKRVLEESLRTQEQRYEKMKNHAVQQLENANIKLAEQVRSHNLELTKLRAQLKKEEISRASIQEQLLQKTKENEELVKICDELINGSGGAS
ncbi:transforming acidic coiled-coil-containing protein 2 isoform X2 [Culicoides brevitarsis]|uniref:transforming acidic coiled-coil-containing protein 2 isoform X2 n=1 Tax=Culicoides brevitarsis TaxID=469753 RepID=UPI00307C97F7